MNKKISTLIAITIIVVLAVLVVGGIFGYQYWLKEQNGIRKIGEEEIKKEVETDFYFKTKKISDFYGGFFEPVFSPDGQKAVYLRRIKIGEDYAVFNGKTGKKYENVEGFLFSPDSKNLAYVAKDAGKQFVVLNGEEGKKYDDIFSLYNLTFSPDSKALAYVASESNKQFVVLNGEEGKRYDKIGRMPGGDILFSPDSKNLAYVAKDAGKQFVVLDGEEGKKYEAIKYAKDSSLCVFSPDSKALAYVASESNKQFVVLNGEEGKRYDKISNIVFSPNSKSLAYFAKDGNKGFLIVNNKEEKAYNLYDFWVYRSDVNDFHYFSYLQFSPDSNNLTYVASEKGLQFVVIDGKEDKKYNFHWSLQFSPDSKNLVYEIGGAEGQFAVVNGKEGKKYDRLVGYYKSTFHFSPDSSKLAYIAEEEGKQFVVLSDKEDRRYDKGPANVVAGELGHLKFSPDGKSLAYVVTEAGAPGKSGKRFVVLNDKEGKKYDWVTNLQFSQDSRYFGYNVVDDNEIYWVVEKLKEGMDLSIRGNADWETYSLIGYWGNRCAIKYPNNWQIEHDEATNTIYLTPKEKRIPEDIWITINCFPKEKGYIDDKGGKDLVPLCQTGKFTLSRTEKFEAVYSKEFCILSEDSSQVGTITFQVRDGRQSMDYYLPDSEIEEELEIFSQMLSTFRFIE